MKELDFVVDLANYTLMIFLLLRSVKTKCFFDTDWILISLVLGLSIFAKLAGNNKIIKNDLE